MENFDAFLQLGIESSSAKKQLDAILKLIASSHAKIPVELDKKSVDEAKAALDRVFEAETAKIEFKTNLAVKQDGGSTGLPAVAPPILADIEQFVRTMSGININPEKIDQYADALAKTASAIQFVSGSVDETADAMRGLIVESAIQVSKEQKKDDAQKDAERQRRFSEYKKQKEQQEKRQEQGRRFVAKKGDNKEKGRERAKRIAEQRQRQEERAQQKIDADKKKRYEAYLKQKAAQKKRAEAGRKAAEKKEANRQKGAERAARIAERREQKRLRFEERMRRIQQRQIQKEAREKDKARKSLERMQKKNERDYAKKRQANERRLMTLRKSVLGSSGRAGDNVDKILSLIPGIGTVLGILGIGAFMHTSASSVGGLAYGGAENAEKNRRLDYEFGNGADDARNYIEDFSSQFNVSRDMVRDFQLDTQSFFNRFQNKDEAASNTRELSERAFDVARRRGMDPQDVMDNMLQALDGSHDAFHNLNIAMNDIQFTERFHSKFKKTEEFASDRERLDVRLDVLLEGTEYAKGTLEKEGASMKMIFDNLQGTINESWNAIGQGLAPVMAELAASGGDLAEYIRSSGDYFQRVGRYVSDIVMNVTGLGDEAFDLKETMSFIDFTIGQIISHFTGGESQKFSEQFEDLLDLLVGLSEDTDSFWAVMTVGFDIFSLQVHRFLDIVGDKMEDVLVSAVNKAMDAIKDRAGLLGLALDAAGDVADPTGSILGASELLTAQKKLKEESQKERDRDFNEKMLRNLGILASIRAQVKSEREKRKGEKKEEDKKEKNANDTNQTGNVKLNDIGKRVVPEFIGIGNLGRTMQERINKAMINQELNAQRRQNAMALQDIKTSNQSIAKSLMKNQAPTKD